MTDGAGTTPEADRLALERWRLVLGAAGSACLGGQGLGESAAGQDAALDWLYGRDEEWDQREVRRGGDRQGGAGPSVLTTVDWLDNIHRLFPKETIERLERDAVERYEIHDVVTDPAVLERVEPNPALLRAVLRTKHLMNPEVLRLARRIVEAVVRELVERLATEVRQVFHGTRARRPSQFRVARNFDFRRTIRANLGHYRPDERRLYLETAHFFSRTRRHIDQWQVILLVDQSGSMVSSVIHAAVTAACLWGLPGVKTHLIAFDTEVVDLTSDVTDPVELLLKVQLGGGTDIARAVAYGAQLVENPRRTIFAVISDFYEGGSESALVRGVRQLVEQGTRVLGLAALDEEANPDFDRELAQRLADVGARMGAMTPGQLAEFVAECAAG
ncbi:VWA domain-containing protein [Goodfellowiella coeruleoviolacea]|uniref:VWA domain containing CoxE-like protein n=1 Tax=Goodfellowiella coeruleoviolacea TaxID=334858 RepID=A0AAE3KEL2_9PSEU|nr:VWA domain-containing protein [Goodfellowiella coeruleoviolacea]MCP2164017.1 VWA domain containing CoxE-like protein [Goodfellowiella coeruleoviolacea]